MAKPRTPRTTGTDLATVDQQVNAAVAAISEKIGAVGGNKIQIQGKTFKMPDGRVHPGPVECVIVEFNARNMYYETEYDPANITPPVCFAIGDKPKSMVPSDNSPNKQAESCNECPWDAYKSASNGKGKACRNSRLLAILPLNATAEDALMLIGVSPTALTGFDGYVTHIAAKYDAHVIKACTSIAFDPTSAFPKLVFSYMEFNKMYADHWGRHTEAVALLNAEPDMSQVNAVVAQASKAKAKPRSRTAARR